MKRAGTVAWRTILGAALTLFALAAEGGAAQDEWRDAYKVGDRVELNIIGPLWQKCVVTENTPGSVMKGSCEEFVEPPPSTYRRAGGVYILSRSDTRKAGRESRAAVPAAGIPTTRRPAPVSATAPGQGEGARQSFAVGDRVEIEASNHWVPCVVAENQPPSIMRVRCDAYPTLSRDAGVYTVDRDNPAAVRHATGRIGKQPTPPRPSRQAPAPAGLRIGEYACYGSGGRIMAGLGFRVLSGNRYADLEGGNAGSFSISGTTVTFRGGHLDAQTGRDLRGHSFTIAARAECEPF